MIKEVYKVVGESDNLYYLANLENFELVRLNKLQIDKFNVYLGDEFLYNGEEFRKLCRGVEIMDNNLEVIPFTCKADSSDYNEFNKYINCFKEKVLKDSENGEILIKFFNYLLTDLDSIYITTGDSIDRKTIDLFKRYVLKELRRKKEND